MLKAGTVFWITGLSGSGKSTLANQLNSQLHKLNKCTVLLDGDELRQALGASASKGKITLE